MSRKGIYALLAALLLVTLVLKLSLFNAHGTISGEGGDGLTTKDSAADRLTCEGKEPDSVWPKFQSAAGYTAKEFRTCLPADYSLNIGSLPVLLTQWKNSGNVCRIEQLYQDTKDSCDFCQYKRFTAQEETGRMESNLSYTAANTFRYAVEHQLIIMRNHHTLNWSKDELVDMLALSVKWLKTQFERKYAYPYPVISWDTLPPGGGTQFHPHVQAALTADNYPGVMESWVIAARHYFAKYKTNYFTDLILVHDSLGLTVRYKSAVAIATLTPKKDNEIVIFSEEGNEDHFSLLYAVIRTYIEDKQLYSFSMSIALPKLLAPNGCDTESVPAFTRIATRQRIGVPKSDVSSLELYTFFNVVSDPFALVKEIQRSVDTRLK